MFLNEPEFQPQMFNQSEKTTKFNNKKSQLNVFVINGNHLLNRLV